MAPNTDTSSSKEIVPPTARPSSETISAHNRYAKEGCWGSRWNFQLAYGLYPGKAFLSITIFITIIFVALELTVT